MTAILNLSNSQFLVSALFQILIILSIINISLEEYSNDEMMNICRNAWEEIEKLGQKPIMDFEHCFEMIDMVYKSRRLMPTAEFDLTHYSLSKEEEIENYANMDMYSGELAEITAKDQNKIDSLTLDKSNVKRNLASKIPESFDLRSNEANRNNGGSCITFPDNQGKCANCYNFSALSAIEGATCRQLGKRIPPLSQQHSLDCWLQSKGSVKACSGGQTFEVFNYAIKSKVCTRDSYPSTTHKTGKLGECKSNCNECVGIKNFKWSYTGSSILYEDPWDVITDAIYNYGPVTVSVCSLMPGFNLYSGGYYEPPTCGSIWCGTRQVDHAVTLIGYGVSESGKRYYIMKNSWGLSWGNKGFMNISADMCSTFFNPGWVTSVSMDGISDYCLNREPDKNEIAHDFVI
ncbi:unnamed protein product [Cryptosporidium hominis]|uniref:Papain family cysteine protease n=1 Tax=Cryptosporidium hominis TaxID=237895 RepID=A0A0S4TCE4_CRYHO|nr:Papain family cysteine protease [Cryptosporidium hominis]CUV04902.1 unnamed protein product [Cryptosporidium hominis]|eukprot:PPS92545.1 Papain family cysteine protease [Cryptosporidium hominis]